MRRQQISTRLLLATAALTLVGAAVTGGASHAALADTSLDAPAASAESAHEAVAMPVSDNRAGSQRLAVAPAPPTTPNLVPAWVRGGARPLSADNGISVAVQNLSTVQTEYPFSVDVYIDGELVSTFEMAGTLPGGAIARWEDRQAGLMLPPGEHTISMTIDPGNAVAETDETDNTFTTTFTVGKRLAAPESLTETQIEQAIATLVGFVAAERSGSPANGADHADAVRQIAEAGYYLTTGRTVGDVDIRLMGRADYLEQVDEVYAAEFAVSPKAAYPRILQERERTKATNPGFMFTQFGRPIIIVDIERDVLDAVTVLAHELGHVRQAEINSSLADEAASYAVEAVREAGAQQFERAFWQAVEERAGVAITEFGRSERLARTIEEQLAFWVREANGDEHNMGYLIAWGAVLNDPALAAYKAEVLASGRLDAASTFAVFEHLAGIDAADATAYAEGVLARLSATIETATSVATHRMITELDSSDAGASSLLVQGLLLP